MSKFPYRAQVLARSLQILDLLAESREELGPTALAAHLSLHRSTIHRLLMVMEHHRLVQRDPAEGKYRLGMKLFELGNRAVAQLDLRHRAEPFLRKLVEQTGEDAHVCILDGTEMLSIANVEGTWKLRTPVTIGRRTPVYCTSVGKALIAFLPAAALDLLIEKIQFKRYTDRTLMSPTALRAELARVRQRGFAIDNEEIEAGLRCVGVPIRNHTGQVAAAMSIAGPVFRFKKDRLPGLVRAVLLTARDLSNEMGYVRQSRKSGRP
jgi:IclR family transcriptional regulator, KDG regulon repressor